MFVIIASASCPLPKKINKKRNLPCRPRLIYQNSASVLRGIASVCCEMYTVMYKPISFTVSDRTTKVVQAYKSLSYMKFHLHVSSAISHLLLVLSTFHASSTLLMASSSLSFLDFRSPSKLLSCSCAVPRDLNCSKNEATLP